MRNRLPMGIAAIFVVIAAVGTQMATAWEPGYLAGRISDITAQKPSRLAALGARQQLRDEVCIAMADGRLSLAERRLILADAKRVLKGEEYAAFEQSLDRLVPATSVTATRATKIVQSTKVAPKKLPAATQPKTAALAKSSVTPIIPSDVIEPQPVALFREMR